jgi:formate dehydrogenase subunit gamma
MTWPEWSPEVARDLLSRIDDPGPILLGLQTLQEHFGYVPAEATAIVAETFNVSRADVFGVLTYYSDLRTEPRPDIVLRVCMGEACQAVGARPLQEELAELAADGIEVAHVFCMGNCALGPTVVINEGMIGRATSERVRHIVQQLERT